MLLTILSLIAGYALLFFGDQLPQDYLYIILALSFVLVSYSIFHPLLKSKKDMVGKASMMINILLLGAGFGVLIAGVVYYFQLKSWTYPLIFSAIVFLRKFLRAGIRVSVKEPRSYGIRSETDRGEVVASKSEKRVADWLYDNKYNYIYEETIEFPNGERIKYDFYLPDTDIYIEYWGMAGVKNKDGDKYRARKDEKIEIYKKYGIRMMSLYPADLEELGRVIPAKIAELTGKGGGFGQWLKKLFFGKPKYVDSSEVVTRVGKSKMSEDIGSEMDQSLRDEKVEYKRDKGIESSREDKNKSSEMTFCPNCGHKMEGKAEFCDECGESL